MAKGHWIGARSLSGELSLVVARWIGAETQIDYLNAVGYPHELSVAAHTLPIYPSTYELSRC